MLGSSKKDNGAGRSYGHARRQPAPGRVRGSQARRRPQGQVRGARLTLWATGLWSWARKVRRLKPFVLGAGSLALCCLTALLLWAWPQPESPLLEAAPAGETASAVVSAEPEALSPAPQEAPRGILERQAYGPGLESPSGASQRQALTIGSRLSTDEEEDVIESGAQADAAIQGSTSKDAGVMSAMTGAGANGPVTEQPATEPRALESDSAEVVADAESPSRQSWWPFSGGSEPSPQSVAPSAGLPDLALELGPLTRLPLVLGPPTDLYSVVKGDTLSGIFSRFSLDQRQMYQVLEADYAYLALDTLNPGNELRFWIDPDSQRLEKMAVVFDPAHMVAYQRHLDTFEVTETLLEGEWLASSSEVEIQGSFSLAASRAGLRASEIQQITALFNDKLDFRRQLRAGDRARVLRESQYIEGEATGNQRLLAVEFAGRNWTSTAYLHNDGSYYDEDGQSLNRAFMRHPIAGNQRISSQFNPRRLHPVTRRVSPHNGTDYAASTGTPILAAGDGVVSRVENHPIAGKYVVIDHGGRYRTRYLHMSRIDVRRGQTVGRGQRIGAVGATGRVTGAHLHYEFHINGRAVNSLTANIPMATSVPSSDRQAFLAEVYRYQSEMNALLARVETAAESDDAE